MSLIEKLREAAANMKPGDDTYLTSADLDEAADLIEGSGYQEPFEEVDQAVLPCIVCKRALEAVGSGSQNHAGDANEFRAHGQYGSRIFDPMDGTYLAINICDDCVTQAAGDGRLLHGTNNHLRPWKPHR